MNFIKFLTEAPPGTINLGNTGKSFAGARPAPHIRDPVPKQPAQPAQPKQKKASPMTASQQAPTEQPLNPEGDAALKPFLDASAKSRPDAVAMITLLGSIYQAKRRNPSVQLTDTPKMANTPLLADLYKVAKDKDLSELAAMSQQIKTASTVDPNKGTAPAGANPAAIPQTAAPAQQQPTQPAAGAEKAPEARGASPAQQTQLQQLLDIINKTAPNLTSRQIKAASRQLNQKLRKAVPAVQPNEQIGPKAMVNVS